jgi:hypothetical protein
MTDTTWAAANVVNTDLIRKALSGGAVWVAPITADVVDTLTGTSVTSALQALPTDYEPLGLINEDGISLPREIETSEVRAWGFTEAVRKDIKNDITSLKVTALETSKITLSLSLGTGLSTLTADATTGEVVYDKPQSPPQIYYRVLGIGRDAQAEGDVYFGIFLPRAQIVERDEQQMGAGDDAIQYGFTFQAFYDGTEGTATRYMFGGPGFESRKAAMGF